MVRYKMADVSQLVLQALVKIKESCRQKNNIKSGIIDNLSGTIFLVQKIRKHGEPKTIGFFGAQKRGKSSLINQLLRCNLMPVSPIPMSSVVIKVKHDQTHKQDSFTIDVVHSDGARDSNRDISLESAQLLLKEYGSHKGHMSGEVETIEVTSNFSNSEILENGGILVDTPGAEIAFANELSDSENNGDANRAIDILASTHIVIFVERADLMQSENSKNFFEKNLKPMRPFSVINWKDAYSLDSKYEISDPCVIEAKKQSCMKEIMLKTYGVNLDRVMCVSSKEAENARKNNDNDLLENSNLPVLEDRILRELKNLNPEKGLITCLAELGKVLSQIEDPDIAKDVFQQAKTPFYALLETPDVKGTEIEKIARKIYEQYR